jgi:hypothetical protein
MGSEPTAVQEGLSQRVSSDSLGLLSIEGKGGAWTCQPGTTEAGVQVKKCSGGSLGLLHMLAAPTCELLAVHPGLLAGRGMLLQGRGAPGISTSISSGHQTGLSPQTQINGCRPDPGLWGPCYLLMKLHRPHLFGRGAAAGGPAHTQGDYVKNSGVAVRNSAKVAVMVSAYLPAPWVQETSPTLSWEDTAQRD